MHNRLFFSVGEVPHLRKSATDTEREEAHHRKMSFDEDFLALLRKHGVAFDPKFVFG